ncbi:hypothetical protein F5146DRAFT_1166837 [Armillaria mellea]|nr:hypothetical protein F5146DRAFT_1166837 [Armillaria mellea]
MGDIVSVSVLGRSMVVINSVQTTIGIPDKKRAVYSDRPMVAMGELIGRKNGFVLMPYGSRFCDSSRRVHQIFRNKRSFQTVPAYRRVRGASISTKSRRPPLLGTFLANSIPILRHIPDWFPGAEFKRTAKEWQSTLHELVEQLYNYVKQRILEDGMSSDKEFDVKWTAATLYIGLPHSVSEDDVQSGNFIPKRCVVLANIGNTLHDLVVYAIQWGMSDVTTRIIRIICPGILSLNLVGKSWLFLTYRKTLKMGWYLRLTRSIPLGLLGETAF